MATQTELFEDKNVQIVVRCKESFKNEVKFLAKEIRKKGGYRYGYSDRTF